MDKIIKLCKKHKLILIEDSAETLGQRLKEKKQALLELDASLSFQLKI